nr:SRPBCC domain-containing protein [Anaerolineae bacterium]
MSDIPKTVTLEQIVKTRASQAYRAFTSATLLRDWFSDGAVADGRVGGTFHIWWNHGHYATGEYTKLEENKRVEFTWRGRAEPQDTSVTVHFSETDGTTAITLTHSDIGPGISVDEIRRGWETGLENLQSILEDGLDLRVYRRPMLGITIDEALDKDRAEKLGAPVSEGVVVGSALPGMGALDAGIQKGDIIVQLADKPITDFASFIPAIAPYKAGDVVSVSFYRGGEKHSVMMKLSGRPLPEVPASVGDLASRLEEIYHGLSDELSSILSSITEEEATFNPQEGEWNVKQILAHLILSERATMIWMGSLISGNEMVNFPGNIQAMHDAVIAIYPSIPDLFDELNRLWKEITAITARLPESFVANRSSYVKVATALLQTGYHPRMHFDQIKNAAEAARK